MKRTYQILVMIIVILMAYLVVDFFQGRAEVTAYQEQLGKITAGPSGPTTDSSIGAGNKNIFGDLATLFGKPQNQPATTINPTVKAPLKLNGFIAEAGKPTIAIITHTTDNNFSGWYKSGERLGEWEIISIDADKETIMIRNNAGVIDTITMGGWGTGLIDRITAGYEAAKDTIQTAPEMANIKAVAEAWMDKSVPIEQIRPKMKALIESLPPRFIDEGLKAQGMSRDDISKDMDLTDYAVRILQIGRNEQIPTVANPLAITFALQVNADNSPMTPTNVFPAGKHRIYACFPNKDVLKGVTKVIARWTNQTTAEAVRVQPYQLNSAAPYNFIWMEKKTEEWQRGTYSVELFKVGTAEKIAGGVYRVE